MRKHYTITPEELGELKTGRDIRWVCVRTPGCLNEFYTDRDSFRAAAGDRGEGLLPADGPGPADCRVFMVNGSDNRVYGIGSAALVAGDRVYIELERHIESPVCFPCSGEIAFVGPEEAEGILGGITPYSGRHVYRPLDIKAEAWELFRAYNCLADMSADGYVYETGYVTAPGRDRFTLLREADERTEIVCFPPREAKSRRPVIHGGHLSVQGKEKLVLISDKWLPGLELTGKADRFIDKAVLEDLRRGRRTQWLYMKCPDFRKVCPLDTDELLYISGTLSEDIRESLEGAVNRRQLRTALYDTLPRFRVFMTCEGRLFGIGRLSEKGSGGLAASLEYSLEYDEPDLRGLPFLQREYEDLFGISLRDAGDILDCITPYGEKIVPRRPGRAPLDPDIRLSLCDRNLQQYVRFEGCITYAGGGLLVFEMPLWKNTDASIACMLPDHTAAADALYSQGECVTVEGRLADCRLLISRNDKYMFDGCILAHNITKEGPRSCRGTEDTELQYKGGSL